MNDAPMPDPEDCECASFGRREVIESGARPAGLETLAERGAPAPWVSVAACEVCGQGWLVGTDDRHNDVISLARLADDDLERIGEEGEWPDTFETFEELLRMARAAGHFVEYRDPENSPLQALVTDLAEERPGIAVSELEELLNIDSALASAFARCSIQEHGCRIELDR